MLAIDLGVFNRKPHEVSYKDASIWSAVWVALALIFAALLFGPLGWELFGEARNQKALEFLTGYLIELSLSVDNLFVFVLIFSYFKVPAKYQHRVLFWGVMGALVMRVLMILIGSELIERFHWVIYIFALILIYGGIKMIRHDTEEADPTKNPVLRLFQKLVPVTSSLHGHSFFVREGGRLMATPLCVVLVAIETTDLIFAVDSIPAVLAVTRDPFVVFTSNVFAILGLRAMYFALAGILKLFRFLHYGLSAILVFIGAKMLLSDTPYAIETVQSLVVVVSLLVVSVSASLLIVKK